MPFAIPLAFRNSTIRLRVKPMFFHVSLSSSTRGFSPKTSRQYSLNCCAEKEPASSVAKETPTRYRWLSIMVPSPYINPRMYAILSSRTDGICISTIVVTFLGSEGWGTTSSICSPPRALLRRTYIFSPIEKSSRGFTLNSPSVASQNANLCPSVTSTL